MTIDEAKAALAKADERVAASQVALDAARAENDSACEAQREAQRAVEAAG